MANSTGQVLGYFLSYVGLLGLVLATCMNEWKTYARANGQAVLQEEQVGLWMKCTGVGGVLTCTGFTSILFQTWKLNVSRAMMITSIILCVLASLVAMLGLKCTRCLEGDKRLKSIAAITGGILSILGGLCAFSLITWYAHDIVEDFHTNSAGMVKYGFGSALFVGGSAALLSIIGGVLLCMCSRTRMQSSSYAAKVSTSQTQATEYV